VFFLGETNTNTQTRRCFDIYIYSKKKKNSYIHNLIMASDSKSNEHVMEKGLLKVVSGIVAKKQVHGLVATDSHGLVVAHHGSLSSKSGGAIHALLRAATQLPNDGEPPTVRVVTTKS
jgi:Ragulator complex protein LAMTOR5